jgi:isocitrate dehydrogenase
MELGYKRPVLFERHAVGGEYGAGFKTVGSGKVVTLFLPKDGEAATIVDQRDLPDEKNAVVT